MAAVLQAKRVVFWSPEGSEGISSPSTRSVAGGGGGRPPPSPSPSLLLALPGADHSGGDGEQEMLVLIGQITLGGGELRRYPHDARETADDAPYSPHDRIVRGYDADAKRNENIGFARRPSFGLIKNVDLTTILRPEDLIAFLNRI